MNVWICTSLIIMAGALGGFVNALISSNGFALPRRISGIWCPGALSTILIGAFAAFASWAFYGSGADFDLADSRAVIHLRYSAVAGAFLVGVVGAKWITNEADKGLLKESVKMAATKDISKEQTSDLVSGTALDVLHNVRQA
jgi:hypothetical protein